MNRTSKLRDDLDDLVLVYDQIDALDIDCHATRDMLSRLSDEISAIRREILLLDADALLRASHVAGGLH